MPSFNCESIQKLKARVNNWKWTETNAVELIMKKSNNHYQKENNKGTTISENWFMIVVNSKSQITTETTEVSIVVRISVHAMTCEEVDGVKNDDI